MSLHMDVFLSDEQRLLLRCLARGMTAASAARHLDVSENKLRAHVSALCRQLGVQSPMQVLTLASRRGLI